MNRFGTALVALLLTGLTACNNADGLFSDGPLANGDDAVEKDSVLPPSEGLNDLIDEPPGPGEGEPAECPGPIDFETDGSGSLAAGTPISTQLSALGIANVMCTNNNPDHPNTCILFDSANPTGDDYDLGTPNQAYNGPGVGDGGLSNDTAHNNVLIIAENLHDCENNAIIDEPDDEASGGIVHFDFTEISTVNSITMLDMDAGENSWVEVLLDEGDSINIQIPDLGDNSLQTLAIEVAGAVGLNVHLGGSGAIAALDICNAEPPPPNEDECKVDNDCADPDLQECVAGECVDRPALFGGIVFFDLNGNGLFESQADIQTVAAVTLYEDADQDGMPDEGGMTVSGMADSVMGYSFEDVNPYGTYVIGFEPPPAGFGWATPNVGNDDFDSDVLPSTGYTGTIVTAPGDEKGNISCGYALGGTP